MGWKALQQRDWYLYLPRCQRRCWGSLHRPRSLCFVREVRGEVLKSWLHRADLEQICVIKKHVGINSSHCHCSDNNAVPFNKWIFQLSKGWDLLKRYNFKPNGRPDYHNSHQPMSDSEQAVWVCAKYRWKKQKELCIWWFEVNRRLHSPERLPLKKPVPKNRAFGGCSSPLQKCSLNHIVLLPQTKKTTRTLLLSEIIILAVITALSQREMRFKTPLQTAGDL